MKVLEFEFPDDLHYLVEHQVWARLHDDGTATVGITSLGIHLSGEVFMCRPKVPGTEVLQGRGVAVVELAKSIVSVKSPVTGAVVEGNPLLAGEPEWVHRDPYGRGWIARLRLQDFAADAPQLVHGAAVEAAMRHHAWLNGVGPPVADAKDVA
jgi:glycine cleavage system H protein